MIGLSWGLFPPRRDTFVSRIFLPRSRRKNGKLCPVDEPGNQK